MKHYFRILSLSIFALMLAYALANANPTDDAKTFFTSAEV